MIQFILYMVIFQLLFLIAYDIFHKKDTFFSLNRAYLLITSVLSFILPFIKIKSIQENIPEEYVVNLPTVFIGQQPENISATETVTTIQNTSYVFDNINWWVVIYISGVILMLLHLISKSVKLRKLRTHSTRTKIGNYKLLTLPKSKDAFSFWNTIYIGGSIPQLEKEQIITHEIVHLEQKHSLDLLWFEMLKIIFWFNPLVYIYQSKINTLHEFIADAKSVGVLGKRKYYEQLLNTVFDTEDIRFINQFYNRTLLKKRILMLQKSKSKTITKYKYLIVLPILALMIALSSFTRDQENLIPNQNKQIIKKLESKITEENNSISKADRTISSTKGLKEAKNKEVIVSINDTGNKENLVNFHPQNNCLNQNAKYDYTSGYSLKVKNESKNSEIIVKLVSLETFDTIRRIYLKTQQEYLIENIPKDKYQTHIEYGNDYTEKTVNGLCLVQFKNNRLFEKSLDILDFNLSRNYKLTLELKEKDELNEIPFAVVEKTPTTEACKDITDNSERKKCVSDEIKKFVNKNFNVAEMRKYAQPDMNRIYVRFKIDTQGNIVGIQARGPAPQMEKEAIRVINLLPQMIPGEHHGEKVSVLYSLPIVFYNAVKTLEKTVKKTPKPVITESIILSENLTEYLNHDIKSGYYLITSIFKRKSYLDRGIKRLKEQGQKPKCFKNPKDGYSYVYLERYDILEEAKKMLFSDMNNTYDGDLYILKVHGK